MPYDQIPQTSNAAHALLGKLYSDARKRGPHHAVDVQMSVATVIANRAELAHAAGLFLPEWTLGQAT